MPQDLLHVFVAGRPVNQRNRHEQWQVVQEVDRRDRKHGATCRGIMRGEKVAEIRASRNDPETLSEIPPLQWGSGGFSNALPDAPFSDAPFPDAWGASSSDSSFSGFLRPLIGIAKGPEYAS